MIGQSVKHKKNTCILFLSIHSGCTSQGHFRSCGSFKCWLGVVAAPTWCCTGTSLHTGAWRAAPDYSWSSALNTGCAAPSWSSAAVRGKPLHPERKTERRRERSFRNSQRATRQVSSSIYTICTEIHSINFVFFWSPTQFLGLVWSLRLKSKFCMHCDASNVVIKTFYIMETR